jgi:hypothetical protein
MRVRILSAWPGSPPCGAVADVDDAIASARVSSGEAERAADAAPGRVVETAMDTTPVETALAPAARPKGRKERR